MGKLNQGANWTSTLKRVPSITTVYWVETPTCLNAGESRYVMVTRREVVLIGAQIKTNWKILAKITKPIKTHLFLWAIGPKSSNCSVYISTLVHGFQILFLLFGHIIGFLNIGSQTTEKWLWMYKISFGLSPEFFNQFKRCFHRINLLANNFPVHSKWVEVEFCKINGSNFIPWTFIFFKWFFCFGVLNALCDKRIPLRILIPIHQYVQLVLVCYWW